jgi:hypothetical protein
MIRLRFVPLCVLLALAVGCDSGPRFTSVSGVVTLDGKPYGKAAVSFQPIGTPENPNPGRGSSAYTDENGRFILTSDNTKDGAVVGKHLVRITTRARELAGEPGIGSPDGGPVLKPVEPIPPEWHSESQKEFVVPPGGTDQANFDIVTKR